jgi:hypothetical protein
MRKSVFYSRTARQLHLMTQKEKGAVRMSYKMNLSHLKKFHSLTALLVFLVSSLAFLPAVADADESGPVTVTVTAVGKKDAAPPEIKRDDVQFYKNKERLQLADWRRGDTLYLGILIDDSLNSNIANQWDDLRAFIMSQPDTTFVAVAYARDSAAMVAQDFTKDHALAAKALRIPLGNSGAFSSPYLTVLDWLKRWPDSNERKSIIFFSSGIDYFRGSWDPVDPDLDSTVERAQKQNTNIWTIYYPDAGHFGRREFRAFNAQSNLSRLSDATGAECFALGLGTPVSLKSYFDEIREHLNNQYLASVSVVGGKKGNFERVRVTTEVPKVEFMVPSEVFVPPAR